MQRRNDDLRKSDRLGSYEERRERVSRFNLTSDIFFCKVMEDQAACEELVWILTKEKMTVKEVKTQYSIRNIENHSVVLDVLAEGEDGRVVNVEIHLQEDEDHVRRVRYYLGSIDVSFLEKGNPFEALPEIYLIYITELDFIGKNQGIYWVERTLKDCGVPLDNGVHEMYVNLQEEAPEQDQKELLRYMKATTLEHETGAFPQLASRVRMLKEKREGVEIMCDVFGDILELEKKEAREEGLAEGKAEGIAKGIAKVIAIIRKKHRKLMAPDEIAELLEMEPEYVSQVVTLLESMPGADDLRIADELVKAKLQDEAEEKNTTEE